MELTESEKAEIVTDILRSYIYSQNTNWGINFAQARRMMGLIRALDCCRNRDNKGRFVKTSVITE